MIQEKQLKELFKYIEQNWDVCVSQVDKTDIKRIFGGVLCEDIMNDTLHEVKAEPEELKGNCSTFDGSRLVDQVQPELNPIEQAYERGEKIRRKNWPEENWIQKLSETESTSDTLTTYSNIWDFATNPEEWELYTEPTEKPSSQVILDNSFDRDRFEAMFRAVLVGDVYENAIKATEEILKELDAYYATKEGGNNE